MRFQLLFLLISFVAVACLVGYAAAAYVMTSPVSDVVTVQPLPTPDFEWGPGW